MKTEKLQRFPCPSCGEGCYLLVSFASVDPRVTLGETRVRPIISFFYDAGDLGVEWVPDGGPLQVFRPTLEEKPGARPHYFYPFIDGFREGSEFSHTAVTEYKLAALAHEGNFNKIFRALMLFAVTVRSFGVLQDQEVGDGGSAASE